MQTNRFVPVILMMLCLHVATSCENDDTPSIEPAEESYADSLLVRTVLDGLYTKGVPALHLYSDDNDGIPAAWESYLSGLFKSEATEGFYPDLTDRQLSSPSVRELSSSIYARCFDGIEAADSIVSLLPDTPGFSLSERVRLAGEAKFFRALNRFYLIRAFGGYPNKRTDTSFLKPEAAFSVVEKDLLDAVATLPEKGFVENHMHVTAYAARTLLAEVYLSMSGKTLGKDRYRQAAELLRPVIHSGKHRLEKNGALESLSAFNVLRTTPTSDEYLYVAFGESGHSLASFAFPRKAREWEQLKTDVAFNAFEPTRTFMRCYEDNDLRGKDRQFFHTFLKIKDDGKTVFELFNPAPYFWISEDADPQEPARQAVGIYRYSEVLLMASEAIVQSEGVTAEAVSYLAQVRSRATEADEGKMQQPLMSLSVEDFLHQIWLERLRELPFEMKQLTDINRTGYFPESRNDTLIFVPYHNAAVTGERQGVSQGLYLPHPARSSPSQE